MSEFTPQQEAVFDDCTSQDSKGHTYVQARAGSGKSTTLVEAVSRTKEEFPDKDLKCLVFGHDNAAILREKLARVGCKVEARTFHAYGALALTECLGGFSLDDQMKDEFDFASVPAKQRYTTRRILSLAKNMLLEDPDAILHAADEIGIDYEDGDQTADWILKLLDLSRRVSSRSTLSNDDLIWLPTQLKDVTLAKRDHLFVDECLPAKTPVLLADGTSRTIGEIVDGKLPISVLAFDTKTGLQKACRVTAWHKIPNRKPLVKVTVQYAGGARGKTTGFVVCTTDHKLWADKAWIQAGDLKPGMIAQFETSAAKSHVYKITTRGRRVLSRVMMRKNRKGMKARRRNGGYPPIQGGNGKGLTIPEQLLLEALGPDWIGHHIVATKQPRGSGYPTNYKLDLANIRCRTAVEVDGMSHKSWTRQEQDAKKEAFLHSLGWTVIRVPNRDAVQRSAEIAKQINANVDCPVDAVIRSVEPVSIKDYFVYDITVEDCHNFYANGVLVHNCQDTCRAQFAMLEKMIKPEGRITAFADPQQAIFAFRGADRRAVETYKSVFKPRMLPLSVSFRCCQAVIKEARRYAPDIQAREDAPQGVVRMANVAQLLDQVEYGDYVLSRTNAPLIQMALRLWKTDCRVSVAGRELEENLLNLMKTFSKSASSPFEMRSAASRWLTKKMAALQPDQREARAILADKLACINALLSDAKSVSEAMTRARSLFTKTKDPSKCVTLSTVHRSKGDERNRVFLLKNTLRTYNAEELNIAYVGITRARDELVYVEGDV